MALNVSICLEFFKIVIVRDKMNKVANAKWGSIASLLEVGKRVERFLKCSTSPFSAFEMSRGQLELFY